MIMHSPKKPNANPNLHTNNTICGEPFTCASHLTINALYICLLPIFICLPRRSLENIYIYMVSSKIVPTISTIWWHQLATKIHTLGHIIRMICAARREIETQKCVTSKSHINAASIERASEVVVCYYTRKYSSRRFRVTKTPSTKWIWRKQEAMPMSRIHIISIRIGGGGDKTANLTKNNVLMKRMKTLFQAARVS